MTMFSKKYSFSVLKLYASPGSEVRSFRSGTDNLFRLLSDRFEVEEELREITAKKESTANNGHNIYNWTMRIEVLTERLPKLKADLSRKQKEEEKMTSKKIEVSKKLAELKILFDT
jgi:hypothetical protein